MTMMTVFSYLFSFSTIQNSHSLDAMKNSHQVKNIHLEDDQNIIKKGWIK